MQDIEAETLDDANIDSRKGAWTAEEDDTLRALVNQHGTQNWTIISAGVLGRSGKSCRLRWHNQLNPEVNKTPFSEWEQAVIVRAQSSHQNRWAAIARLLHGRTDNAVKNHWHATLNRKNQNGTLKNKYLEEGVTLEWLLEHPEHGAPEEQACRAILSKAGVPSKAAAGGLKGKGVAKKRASKPRPRWSDSSTDSEGAERSYTAPPPPAAAAAADADPAAAAGDSAGGYGATSGSCGEVAGPPAAAAAALDPAAAAALPGYTPGTGVYPAATGPLAPAAATACSPNRPAQQQQQQQQYPGSSSMIPSAYRQLRVDVPGAADPAAPAAAAGCWPTSPSAATATAAAADGSTGGAPGSSSEQRYGGAQQQQHLPASTYNSSEVSSCGGSPAMAPGRAPTSAAQQPPDSTAAAAAGRQHLASWAAAGTGYGPPAAAGPGSAAAGVYHVRHGSGGFGGPSGSNCFSAGTAYNSSLEGAGAAAGAPYGNRGLDEAGYSYQQHQQYYGGSSSMAGPSPYDPRYPSPYMPPHAACGDVWSSAAGYGRPRPAAAGGPMGRYHPTELPYAAGGSSSGPIDRYPSMSGMPGYPSSMRGGAGYWGGPIGGPDSLTWGPDRPDMMMPGPGAAGVPAAQSMDWSGPAAPAAGVGAGPAEHGGSMYSPRAAAATAAAAHCRAGSEVFQEDPGQQQQQQQQQQQPAVQKWGSLGTVGSSKSLDSQLVVEQQPNGSLVGQCSGSPGAAATAAARGAGLLSFGSSLSMNLAGKAAAGPAAAAAAEQQQQQQREASPQAAAGVEAPTAMAGAASNDDGVVDMATDVPAEAAGAQQPAAACEDASAVKEAEGNQPSQEKPGSGSAGAAAAAHVEFQQDQEQKAQQPELKDAADAAAGGVQRKLQPVSVAGTHIGVEPAAAAAASLPNTPSSNHAHHQLMVQSPRAAAGMAAPAAAAGSESTDVLPGEWRRSSSMPAAVSGGPPLAAGPYQQPQQRMQRGYGSYTDLSAPAWQGPGSGVYPYPGMPGSSGSSYNPTGRPNGYSGPAQLPPPALQYSGGIPGGPCDCWECQQAAMAAAAGGVPPGPGGPPPQYFRLSGPPSGPMSGPLSGSAPPRPYSSSGPALAGAAACEPFPGSFSGPVRTRGPFEPRGGLPSFRPHPYEVPGTFSSSGGSSRYQQQYGSAAPPGYDSASAGYPPSGLYAPGSAPGSGFSYQPGPGSTGGGLSGPLPPRGGGLGPASRVSSAPNLMNHPDAANGGGAWGAAGGPGALASAGSSGSLPYPSQPYQERQQQPMDYPPAGSFSSRSDGYYCGPGQQQGLPPGYRNGPGGADVQQQQQQAPFSYAARRSKSVGAFGSYASGSSWQQQQQQPGSWSDSRTAAAAPEAAAGMAPGMQQHGGYGYNSSSPRFSGLQGPPQFPTRGSFGGSDWQQQQQPGMLPGLPVMAGDGPGLLLPQAGSGMMPAGRQYSSSSSSSLAVRPGGPGGQPSGLDSAPSMRILDSTVLASGKGGSRAAGGVSFAAAAAMADDMLSGLGGMSSAAGGVGGSAGLVGRGVADELGLAVGPGAGALELEALEFEKDAFMGVLDDMLGPCGVDDDLLMMA